MGMTGCVWCGVGPEDECTMDCPSRQPGWVEPINPLVDKATGCPDGGTCHHYCADGPCWRVAYCGPLSNVFPDDEWPDEIKRQNGVEIRRSPGAELIAAERQRQIDEEGWTPEHDDEHGTGELRFAASCYLDAARITQGAPACAAAVRRFTERHHPTIDLNFDEDFQQMTANPARHYYGWDKAPDTWPWGREYWKPTADPLGNLVKAGALIAAEIDRLQRKAAL